jgi:hypothetical protein
MARAFQNGDGADGWRSVGHSAVRVAALAGGFVGDLVSELF